MIHIGLPLFCQIFWSPKMHNWLQCHMTHNKINHQLVTEVVQSYSEICRLTKTTLEIVIEYTFTFAWARRIIIMSIHKAASRWPAPEKDERCNQRRKCGMEGTQTSTRTPGLSLWWERKKIPVGQICRVHRPLPAMGGGRKPARKYPFDAARLYTCTVKLPLAVYQWIRGIKSWAGKMNWQYHQLLQSCYNFWLSDNLPTTQEWRTQPCPSSHWQQPPIQQWNRRYGAIWCCLVGWLL